MIFRRSALVVISLLMIVGLVFSPLGSAKALSGSDFMPGRIIDDTIFTNKNAMSVAQIQQFLNARVPTCEINHSAYNAQNPPPYTCLKDYQENTTTGANNFGQFTSGSPNSIAGGKSAAQIIWDASQQYGINPQVLIVLLQKEQGLVTDTWPLLSQFTKATGYLCPDTAACNSNAGGFSKQVFGAAWQFRNDFNGIDTPGFFSVYGKGVNNIRLNPNAACGTKSVNIVNQATAVLYKYTPYTPNDAALNNLYGVGDGCSAYGNRNFWRYFNDWFGSSTSMQSAVSLSVVSQPPTAGIKGQEVTYSFNLTNNFSYAISLDSVGVVGRAGDISAGANRDFGWVGPVTLAAGETRLFTATTTLVDAGNVYMWPTVIYQGGYVQYTNARVSVAVRAPNISLESPLSASVPAPYYAGQLVSFSASIKNNESVPIKADSLGIPIRFYGRYNYDTGWSTSAVTINPGQTATIAGSVILDKPGPYTAWLSWNLGGTYTNLSPLVSLNVLPTSPSFILTYTETPNVLPATGEDVTVRFKLKNTLPAPIKLDAVGIVGRLDSASSTNNRDFGWVGPETFAAGEEKTYSFTRNISELNRHYLWVAINFNGAYTQYTPWGFTLNPHIANITLSAPVSVSPGLNVSRGQTITTSAQLKNNEPKPIRYSAVGIPVKYYGVYNYDSAWLGAGTFAATGQSGDTITINGATLLDKPGPYNYWASILIGGKYQTVGTPGIVTAN